MATANQNKLAQVALRVAQSRFTQTLKRNQGDQQAAPPVPVDSSTSFCALVAAVLERNTTDNIQACKEWIVSNIASSKTRTAVLGEYLIAVSKSAVAKQPPTSAKTARNRIDVLLLVSDVLHTDQYHRESDTAPPLFATTLRPYIDDLVELAARAVPGRDSPACTKLNAIIHHWASSGYFDASEIDDFRERVDDGLAVAQGAPPRLRRTYALPESFGDRNAPWHNLPVSYMLEPLLRKPDYPIAATTIKAKPLNQKQPSDRVRKLLEDYFEDIDLECLPTADNPTGETKKYKLWVDHVGQVAKQSKVTGETTTVRNGYGWATNFCQDMQANGIPERVTELREEHKKVAGAPEAPEPMRESRWGPPSRNYGRDSPSARRRRSYSSRVPSGSESRSYSRSYSRSRSRSRSPSRSDSYNRKDRGDRQRSGDYNQSGDYNRRSSRDEGASYNDHSSQHQGRGGHRKRPRNKESPWDDYSDDNGRKRIPQQRNYNASINYDPRGALSQAPPPHPPHSMSGYEQVPPPPPPGQFPGYAMPTFPPPPPSIQQVQGGAVPPPPPPNYQGQFQGAHQNTGGYHDNSYQFGSGHTNYPNTSGYGGRGRGNFRGGHQGGQRGGGRGSYQGQGQGRGGYQGQGQGRGGYQGQGQGRGGYQGQGQGRGGYQGQGQGRGQGRY